MSTSESPPQELQDKLPHDPVLWVRNFLRHPEDPTRPYDFYGPDKEEFLWYLVDDDGPMNPQQWGDINIFLFGRGCLKTATCTSIAGWGTDVYPTMEVDATAPVDDQRYEVIDRFKDKAEESGLADRRVKDKLSHQKFRNKTYDQETGEEYTAYSHVKSRSAWGDGDKLRGLHGHVGIIDEAQDVDEGTFTTFATEAIDRSVPQVDYFPSVFVIGTPKMSNSFFHKLWKMSDKKTWDADEQEWIQEDAAEEFLPGPLKEQKRELQDEIDDLERELEADTTTESRREEIRESIDQKETALDDISGFTVRGWHIDQYNSPLHDDARVAFKKETYSKKKFKNEVLAEFYTPENDLLSNDNVWDALDAGEDISFSSNREERTSDVVVGVDWGGGDGEGAAETVIAVGEKFDEGNAIIHDISVLESGLSAAEEREQVSQCIEQFNADVTIVDEGFGDSDRQSLQDEYGFNERSNNPVYGCWYGNVKKKEEVVWNRFKNKKRFFTANKPYMVRKFVEDFKDGMFTIPSADLSFEGKHDLGTKIVDQLTAPYTDRTETREGKKKLRVESDRNDDIFDALTYIWIGMHKVQSSRSNRSISSHSRRGH